MSHKLYFTNSKNENILLSTGTYELISATGLSGLSADTQTQKAPYQDGVTYLDSLLDARPIDIEVNIRESSYTNLFNKRREIQRIFNPKLGLGTLRYEYPGGVREISAVSTIVPIMVNNSDNMNPNFQKAFISLLCPDPSFRDPNLQVINVSSFEGGFEFLMEFDIDFGEVGQQATVVNNGDLATPILAIFNGPVTNPVLENVTTGEQIAVTITIPMGERLEINTAFGQKSVILYDSMNVPTNAFYAVDPTSTFFMLQPGENVLSYASTGSAGNDVLTVQYYNRYIGI